MDDDSIVVLVQGKISAESSGAKLEVGHQWNYQDAVFWDSHQERTLTLQPASDSQPADLGFNPVFLSPYRQTPATDLTDQCSLLQAISLLLLMLSL